MECYNHYPQLLSFHGEEELRLLCMSLEWRYILQLNIYFKRAL